MIVFVDRFTKMAHFAAIPANCNAGMTAQIFMERVFVNHGMPRVLITDRDPRFTNRFWKHLMASLDCNHLMSTAYHPQTDGQSERTIRIVKDMIRSFCNKRGSDWDTLLVPLEFAYNNSFQSSTQNVPFYLNNGRLPIIPEILALGLPTSSNNDTGQRMQRLAKSHALAKKCLALAQNKQSKYANRRRRTEDFKKGQLVWLSSKYLMREGKTWNKLQPKWLGPFQIIQKISENAVKINSQDFGHKFYPVVNVSRIKPYRGEAPHTGNQNEMAVQQRTNPIIEDQPDKDFQVDIDEEEEHE